MNLEKIKEYFKNINQQQLAQFAMLGDLYKEWNNKINVISRKDIDELYERHVLHSLAIAKVIQFKPNTDILDVGTGGGFPGIPLAIMFSDCNFILVDSIGKKTQVVSAVVDALGLKNVKVMNTRAEKLNEHFDYVVSRAVAPASDLIGWTKHLISHHHFHEKPNGWLLLKGGDLTAELKELKMKYKVFAINDFFKESFFEQKAVVYISSNNSKNFP